MRPSGATAASRDASGKNRVAPYPRDQGESALAQALLRDSQPKLRIYNRDMRRIAVDGLTGAEDVAIEAFLGEHEALGAPRAVTPFVRAVPPAYAGPDEPRGVYIGDEYAVLCARDMTVPRSSNDAHIYRVDSKYDLPKVRDLFGQHHAVGLVRDVAGWEYQVDAQMMGLLAGRLGLGEVDARPHHDVPLPRSIAYWIADREDDGDRFVEVLHDCVLPAIHRLARRDRIPCYDLRVEVPSDGAAVVIVLDHGATRGQLGFPLSMPDPSRLSWILDQGAMVVSVGCFAAGRRWPDPYQGLLRALNLTALQPPDHDVFDSFGAWCLREGALAFVGGTIATPSLALEDPSPITDLVAELIRGDASVGFAASGLSERAGRIAREEMKARDAGATIRAGELALVERCWESFVCLGDPCQLPRLR